MKKIGLLSDTHSYLDPQLATVFKDCDEVWHAGDIGIMDTALELEGLFPCFRAVWGNIDAADLRQRYEECLVFDCEGARICMIHIGGYPGKYSARIKKLLSKEKPDIFICGHSHILKVMPDDQYKLLHLNPGACGRHGWHKTKTVLRFDIDKGRIQNLELIELGARGAL